MNKIVFYRKLEFQTDEPEREDEDYYVRNAVFATQEGFEDNLFRPELSGVDFSNNRDEPVLLGFEHFARDEFPIGYVGDITYTGNALQGSLYFDKSDATAGRVNKNIEKKFFRSLSIGISFNIDDTDPMDENGEKIDDDDFETYPAYYRVNKSNLDEVSVVKSPANSGSRIFNYSTGKDLDEQAYFNEQKQKFEEIRRKKSEITKRAKFSADEDEAIRILRGISL